MASRRGRVVARGSQVGGQEVTAVVLAAGRGSRLRPLTDALPKEMIRFWGKPVLHYLIENLSEAGIGRAVIVVSPDKLRSVRDYFGDGSRFGLKVEYVVQSEQLGPAHAIALTKSQIKGEYILVQYGDSIADENIPLRLILRLREEAWKADGALALRKVDDPQRYGVVRLEGERIAEVVEKPSRPPSDWAVMGTFVLRKEPYFDSIRGEGFDGPEIFPAEYMLRRGASLLGWLFRGERVDVGKPENLFDCSVLTQRLEGEGRKEKMPRIKTVIFDADNTLISTRKVAKECDMAAMEVLSTRSGEDKVRLYREWNSIVQGISGSQEPEIRGRPHSYRLLADHHKQGAQAKEMYRVFMRALAARVKPSPGALAALRQVEDKKLFVATEENRRAALLKLRSTGLLGFFDGVVTSDDTGAMKPSRIYYDIVAKKAGAAPGEVLVVGDSFEKDLVPAVLLGMHVLLVGGPRDLKRLALIR